MHTANKAFSEKELDLLVSLASFALDPAGFEEHTNYNSMDSSFLLRLVKAIQDFLKSFIQTDYVE